MNLKSTFALLLLSALSIHKTSAQNLPAQTTWEGGFQGIKIILRVFEDGASKEKKAEFDVPQQGAMGLKAAKLTITNDSLKVFSSVMQANYGAAFNADKTELTGKWQQGGANIPLIFKRIANKAEAKRPQMPKAPFPYIEEKVVYYNQDKSVQYGATLTIPKSAKPVPAVILITGSGAQDRDETLFGHKLFWVIADHLSRNGIAVLRVDDPGVGESTGANQNATSEDFAKDVMIGIEYLKKHAGISAKNIGLLGHSEGGMIAPLVAIQSTDVAFIVSLAGVGIKGSDIMLKQKGDGYKKSGQYTDDELSRILALDKALLNAAAQKTSIEEMSEAFKTELTNWKGQQNEALLKKMSFTGAGELSAIGQYVGGYYIPWIRYFVSYDPANTLSKITIPVLALNGEKDVQVSAKENLAGFNTLLTQAGNKNFKTMMMPGLNHPFQHAKTGELSEYGEIEETISPEVLDIITKWIQSLKPRK